MQQKELSALTDQELLAEAKKIKSASIINAFLIGFLIGVLVFSIVKSRFGFLALILLYFVYKLVNNSKYDKEELDRILKERNLK
jgi:hypothetical protein